MGSTDGKGRRGEDSSVASRKAWVRERVLALRHSMTPAMRAEASHKICQKIKAMPEYQRATCIAAFAPMAEEVDIWPLIEDCIKGGKTVALPRVADKKQGRLAFHRLSELGEPSARSELKKGAMGILEPAPTKKLISPQLFDFIFIPAVAMDKHKKRLGYGGGFYDRVLPQCKNVCACAPIFHCQLTDPLPCEAHDQSVDFVVTDHRKLG